MSTAKKVGVKERGKTFSIAEVDFLISLVEKYAHVIENKKSDSQTWKQKEDSWKKVII